MASSTDEPLRNEEDATIEAAAIDDQDEDIVPSARRKPADTVMANGGDDVDDDAGLFGSDDEDDGPRQLDDSELDSGDDESRADRTRQGEEEEAFEEMVEETQNIMEASVARHGIPDPSDGELYLFKVPDFLNIEPNAFHANKFRDTSSESAIPHKAAMNTVRWRPSPSNPSQSQSNARVLRWSDGSFTLQIATHPTKQYVVPASSLAPGPRRETSKTMDPGLTKDRRGRRKEGKAYKAEEDSFTYLIAPNASSGLLRTTNKITAQLRVKPTEDAADTALLRLQEKFAAAKKNDGQSATDEVTHIQITEDPELAKKRAELAAKETIRAQRRREAQELRNRERIERGGKRGGGLTVGGLEDDDDELGKGYQGGRTAGLGKRPKPRQNKRGEIYSDDEEEFGHRMRTREDEYDEEDDFVAGSDEEEVPAESEEDENEGIDPASVRGKAIESKRKSPAPANDDEADAEGDPDDDDAAAARAGGEGSPLSRNKRRRIIEDDDEE